MNEATLLPCAFRDDEDSCQATPIRRCRHCGSHQGNPHSNACQGWDSVARKSVTEVRRPSDGGVTDAQIDAITDAQWGSKDDYTYYMAHRAFARALLALQPSAPQPVPLAEGMDAWLKEAWLKEAGKLLEAALTAAKLDGHPMSGPTEWERYTKARDALLAHLAKRPEGAEQVVREASDTQLLDFLAAEYLDLVAFEMPTGAGDADVGWKTLQHHMGEDKPREVGIVYSDDPRAAIRAAMAQGGKS